MTPTTFGIVVATAIYCVYNTVSLAQFGVPHSLSMTYYHWKNKYKAGFLFPIMMYLVVAFMMPAWISMSEGSAFQFLAFLAPAAIAFVGTAPAFLSSDLENKVHSISAVIAAVCSLLWVGLMCPGWWIIIGIWTIICVLYALLTETVKTSYTYWLETIAFGATFTATISHSL